LRQTKKDASTGSILFASLIERDTRVSELHPDKKGCIINVGVRRNPAPIFFDKKVEHKDKNR
jgi:hypothetical protein